MRYENFAKNEYYHVFCRGVNGEKIFVDNRDAARFVFLITHLQSPAKVNNVAWHTESFIKRGVFSTTKENIDRILKKRNVALVSFALMPNHFHILLKNLDDYILSVYMHRVLTAYSKYFNARYKKHGHVFEGPFKAVRVKNNDQLLYLSAYIHKNPKSIGEWESSYDKYPYSSYQDFIGQNRWGSFLSPAIVLDQFKDQAKYKDFVETSTAKEKLDDLQY